MLPHKDAKDIYILGSLEDIQTVLDESSISINTIASSKHVGPIKPRVEDWINQLEHFSKTLVSLFPIHRVTEYLKSCFIYISFHKIYTNFIKISFIHRMNGLLARQIGYI